MESSPKTPDKKSSLARLSDDHEQVNQQFNEKFRDGNIESANTSKMVEKKKKGFNGAMTHARLQIVQNMN